MKSKYFLGLLVAGAMAVAAAAGGCGDDNRSSSSGSSGDTTSTGNGGAGGGTTTSSTAGQGGSGGAGGGGPVVCPGDPDKNCDFDTAEEITIAVLGSPEPVAGDLEPVDSDTDYYKFDGKKGQALLIYTEAKTGMDPFDPTYPDLVMTIYDEKMNQIAENDDPFPRVSNDSEVYTILPDDGTYYIRILECNAWENGGPAVCAPAGDITNTSYNVGIVELDPAANSITAEKTPDNTQAMPDPVEYAKGQQAGTYVLSTLYGFYMDDADVDAYSMKLPSDYNIPATERLIGYFNFPPAGAKGNGSSAPFGGAAIIDTATMKTVAMITETSDEMSPPLMKGGDYVLLVNAPKAGGDFSLNPFYFVTHYGGGSNPVEAEKMPNQNDTSAMAETLTVQMGTESFFVEGDIATAGTDVDWFSMTVPAGAIFVDGVCGAQRSGSGLRSFKMTLLKQDGTTVLKTGTETVDKDLLLQDVAVTAGEKVFLKVEAGMQDANVTSTFYRCGIHFRNMQ